ncbi:hypothetical protein H6F98_05575 [Microcoleus sp. FACHB-SPT15]|uniref:LA_3751/LA_3752 family putative glycosyltransferase n=1 Tax=Microcoleus sp. FACHB-SPT15 TaxID=2692830 RepID=UPI0017826528|nr:hypothetical protein [Microcoleus sp. FACHB-SPT15]MBD1804920.1 hypothetical protein [Microcoleus sp. FACHB-SPT15]
MLIGLGVLFSLYLQLQIPEEVFFSGDAGPKLLLIKQFAEGRLQADLDLPVESWVRNLWDKGLYPFAPPFTYEIDNRYYIQYPFIYPLISAPFYALFGWRGLYIISLVSIWIIWWRFYVVCKRFRLGVISTSLGLATLIFASPLTLYSAMFWEHAIAISLAFWGISIILISPSQNLSNREAILSGILIGLSVWFRQELLSLGLTLIALFALSPKLNLGFKRNTVFLISLILTVTGFLIVNTIAYGHPLGIYSFSLGISTTETDTASANSYKPVITDSFSLIDKASSFFIVLFELIFRLFRYLPITAFSFSYIFLVLLTNKAKLKPSVKFTFLLGLPILFSVPLVGWVGGKEWGARYLLVLIPLISLIATITLNQIIRIRSYSLRYVGLSVFLVLLVGGSLINTFFGTTRLIRDYAQRVLPALNVLRANPNTVVAVSHQYISQDLAAAFSEKVFFLTQSTNDLEQLASVLLSQGNQQFIYLEREDESKKVDYLEFTSGDQRFAIKVTELGEFGSYIVSEASIVRL